MKLKAAIIVLAEPHADGVPAETVVSKGPFLFVSSDPSTPICPDCWKDGVVARLKYGHLVGPDSEFTCMREKKLKRFKGPLPVIRIIAGG